MSTTDPLHNDKASTTATLVIVGIVQFVIPFMVSAVGIALPVIGTDYHASALLLSACITAFVLSLSIFMLPASRFADIHGRKRIFTIGVGLITLTTLALALSPNIYFFISIRFIQGLAAAMIFSNSVAILTSVVALERRGRAMGISVSAVYLGMAAGPTLGGFFIAGFGWRSIFYFLTPLQLLSFVLTLTKLRGEWTSDEDKGFDWLGSIALCCTLVLLIVGTTQLTKTASAKYIIFLGFLCAGIFFRIEKKVSNPLLNLHLLWTNLPFTFNTVATLINYAAAFGVAFLFSLYLQTIKGYSPKFAGFIMVIQPAIQAFLSPVSGKLSDTYAPQRIAAIGIGLCTVGLTTAAFINTHSSLTMIIIVLACLGLGFGLFSTSNTTAIMGSVGSQHYGIAAGLLASMRNMGMLVSMTIVSISLAMFMGDRTVGLQSGGPFIASMRFSFIAFSGLSIFGILFSLGGSRLSGRSLNKG